MRSLRHLSRRTVAAAVAIVAGAVLGVGFASARGAATPATAGVVDIVTNLGYENSAAAGTGMVLSPSGEVLTNNHVIRGATSIRVSVPGTGRSYRASVVGYDVARDVAVLKLQGASGLQTVSLGDSARARVGAAVTAVGNAGGTGRLTVAHGTITGLGKSITASNDQGGSERLRSLIETDAGLQPGDSGGPLLDGSGRVVGMDTAASTGFYFQSTANDGYAIPIDQALSIARQIDAGRTSATVHVGGTAFLGVDVQAAGGYGYGYGDGYSYGQPSPAAVVAGVVSGSPADRAGLAQGDQITALDGHTVRTPNGIIALLLRKHPGNTVALSWIDPLGGRQHASVTLASGPPQ